MSKICVFCNLEFNPKRKEQKFCNHSCSAKFTNKDQSRVKHKCLLCNKATHHGSRRFCSKVCREVYLIKEWKSGNINGATDYGSIKTFVREHLLKECSYKCSQCGFNKPHPVSGTTILQVDHINGNCFDSSSNNLRILCPNCHAMTPTYGARNKNGKRTWKRINGSYPRVRT